MKIINELNVFKQSGHSFSVVSLFWNRVKIKGDRN